MEDCQDSMKIGLVGLPQCGKTTLFNALTGSKQDTASHTSGRSEDHHAIVHVPDERLGKLAQVFQPAKTTPACIEYLDLVGLTPFKEGGTGFSEHFLGELRTVDAVLALIRSFADDRTPHPFNTVDAGRDLEFIKNEFILSDLFIVENRINRLEKELRVHKQDTDVREHQVLVKCRECLEAEKPLRNLELDPSEERLIRGYQFLTHKPLIVVLNIDESDIPDEAKILGSWETYKNQPKTAILTLSARIEMEMQQLTEEEAQLFRDDLGIDHPAMERLISVSYDLLGLISFFTVVGDELRAWTVTTNTHAPQAAGAVHTDMEKGFIKAEVVGYTDFIDRGSMAKCRSDGVLRLEGKDYVVKDGDIITFRFAR
jgi:GTP-binding protein YchF